MCSLQFNSITQGCGSGWALLGSGTGSDFRENDGAGYDIEKNNPDPDLTFEKKPDLNPT